MRDDDDRIDFSALDPARSPQRFEALVQRTLQRAQPEPPSLWRSVAGLRLSLAAVAAVALLAWLPALLPTPAAAPQRSDPALAVVQYSHAGDVLALLESTDGY